MTVHIKVLEDNDWICDCVGPWGSLLILTVKPHQEEHKENNDFICSLCVNCRPLNSVTRSFEFPIPRCINSREDFGDSNVPIYFITFDAKSRYHQVRVRKSDQEKTFKVMPFGPKNATAFYTVMMHFLREDWIPLFQETKHTIMMTNSPSNIVCDDRIIIDDIFLFSNHILTILHYFSCVAQVFNRLSFKLSKCDVFQPHVEYVGHDLTANGNCPTVLKFDLL